MKMRCGSISSPVRKVKIITSTTTRQRTRPTVVVYYLGAEGGRHRPSQKFVSLSFRTARRNCCEFICEVLLMKIGIAVQALRITMTGLRHHHCVRPARLDER